MQGLPLLAPRPLDRLTNSGGGPDMTVSDVRSDDATQLEVQDFSTLTMGRPIGKGGFATVWTARWQGNHLAVKVLDVSSAQQEMAMLQEVAILRRLRHPCICALFGHMLVDQRPALVLEYMAGGSLAAHLFANRYAAAAPVAPQGLLGCKLMEPPPPRTRLADMLSDDKKICFAVQLASGLCFLHSHGILHHDIKTDNALLDANHSVCKLADFGLACLSLNYARDRNKAVGGTLRYLAPERVAEVSRRHAHESPDRDESRGSSSLSLGRTLVSFEDRADVYAFAFLLWELTHERRAFKELTGAAAASGALKGLRPALEAFEERWDPSGHVRVLGAASRGPPEHEHRAREARNVHASSLGTKFNIDADVAAVLRPIIPIRSQLQQRVQTSCYKWVFLGQAPGAT